MFRWSWSLLVIFFCPQCFGDEDGGCTQRTVIVTARDSSGKALPYTLQVADLRGKINAGIPSWRRRRIEAVKKWKYKPYLLNRHPVALETQIAVDFQLHR